MGRELAFGNKRARLEVRLFSIDDQPPTSAPFPMPNTPPSEWSRHLRPEAIRELFEHLPGTLFFAKNQAGEIMLGNRAFVERCGYPSLEKLAGRTDAEIFPPHMAAKYREDDLAVMRTGRPMLQIV